MRVIDKDRYWYCGILAILVEYSAVVYFFSVYRLPLDWSHTISDFGAIPETRAVFNVAFTIAGLLYALFGLWLSRRLKLHSNFMAALGVGVAGQIALSWIPDQGSTNLLHLFCAMVVMVCMPLTVYYFSHVIRNKAVKTLARGIVWAEVAALILIPFVTTLKVTFVSELIAAISFQFWTIVATFKTR